MLSRIGQSLRPEVKLILGILVTACVLAVLFAGRAPSQALVLDPTAAQVPSAPGPTASSEPKPVDEDTAPSKKRQPVSRRGKPARADEGKTTAPRKRAAPASAREPKRARKPVRSTPKRERVAQNPAPKAPATSRPRPKPAPAALTAERLRALPSGASLDSVTAALGPAQSTSQLRSRYGSESTDRLLREEPTGMPCRYYALAATEPAPLARLCFDANGHLRLRDFVAPPA